MQIYGDKFRSHLPCSLPNAHPQARRHIIAKVGEQHVEVFILLRECMLHVLHVTVRVPVQGGGSCVIQDIKKVCIQGPCREAPVW